MDANNFIGQQSKLYAARSLQLAAITMFFAVALGAFGAHSLEGVATAKQLDVWQKAVYYMVVHGLSIFAISFLFWVAPQKNKHWFGVIIVFSLGILLFSGSLVLWVLTAIHWLVFLTPVGGVLFLIGWIGLFWGAKNLKQPSEVP